MVAKIQCIIKVARWTCSKFLFENLPICNVGFKCWKMIKMMNMCQQHTSLILKTWLKQFSLSEKSLYNWLNLILVGG